MSIARVVSQCCFSIVASLLDQYWTSTGPVLDQYWTSTGAVLGQYCISTGASTVSVLVPVLVPVLEQYVTPKMPHNREAPMHGPVRVLPQAKVPPPIPPPPELKCRLCPWAACTFAKGGGGMGGGIAPSPHPPPPKVKKAQKPNHSA